LLKIIHNTQQYKILHDDDDGGPEVGGNNISQEVALRNGEGIRAWWKRRKGGGIEKINRAGYSLCEESGGGFGSMVGERDMNVQVAIVS